MISVEEALNIISSHQKDFGTEMIPLAKSIGRIIKEALYTDRELPPYNRVTMDGIAISTNILRKEKERFQLQELHLLVVHKLVYQKKGLVLR